MKKILIVIYVFYVACYLVKSEVNQDTINFSEVNKIRDPSKLNQLAYEYKETNYLKSKEFAEKALNLATELGNENEVSFSLCLLGYYNFYNSNFRIAFDYFNKALNKAQELNNKKVIALSMNGIGMVLDAWGEHNNSLKFFTEALKILEEINDIKAITSTINNIAKIYYNLGDTEKSLEYLNYNLKLAEKLNNEKIIIYCLNNINIVSSAKNDYKTVLNNYFRILNYFLKKNDEISIASAYHNIANTYFRMADYKKAEHYYLKAIELSEKLNDKYQMGINYSNYANMLITNNKFQEALNYLNKSQKIFFEINMKNKISSNFLFLSELYKKMGNYQLAYENLLKHKNLSDSLSSAEFKEQVAKFQAQYDNKIKENEISILRKEKEIKDLTISKQKTLLISLFVITTILLFLIVLLVRQYKIKQKTIKLIEITNKELIEANEIKDKMFSLLAHDMKNPIFAFNGIVNFIHTEYHNLDDNIKLSMIEQLAKSSYNLTETLENVVQWAKMKTYFAFIPENINLKKAIDELCRLLSLPSERKNIKFINQIPEDKNLFYDKNIFNAILRNILYNAIKFSYKDSNILIKLEKTESPHKVVISVTDYGQGMTKDQIETILTKKEYFTRLGTDKEVGTGLGIKICKELLEKTNSSIKIVSELDKGTTVFLEFTEAFAE